MKQEKWVWSILMFAVHITLFCQWQLQGSEGAGNVLLLFLWVGAVAMLMGAFFVDDKVRAQMAARSRLRKAFSDVRNAAAVGAMAWIGHFWLAGILLLGYAWYCVAAGQKEGGSMT